MENKNIKLMDPINGGRLLRVDENTFISETTGKKFTFDGERKAFIPNYFPDEELNLEDAHIEGDYLVGNTTGKKFLIDDKGNILTPSYIAFKKKQEILAEKLIWRSQRGIEKIDELTSVEDYLTEIKNYINTNDKPSITEFLFSNNKCYFSTHELGQNSKVTHAKIFDNIEDLNESFLEPLIFYQMNNAEEKSELVSDVLMTPHPTDETTSDLDIVTPGQHFIRIKNINTTYAKNLLDKIYERNESQNKIEGRQR